MEALILYLVLFFPGIYSFGINGNSGGAINFSVIRELGRTLSYTIPSLALLWYIISDKNGFSALENEKPDLNDLVSFGIGLPGLIISGLGLSFLISVFSKFSELRAPALVEGPHNIPGFLVMVLSCVCTGYLEESFFRYYLLRKFEYILPQTAIRIFISTALFSLCHLYEGPWGILNAVLAGVLLSVLFVRFRSLHGIAWAHGAYNMFVYIVGSLSA